MANEEKKAIEAERKSIAVESVGKEGETSIEENVENENDDTSGDTSEEKETEENVSDGEDTETEDEKKERIAAEKQQRKDARMQKRIDKLTAEKNLTLEENNRLKKQLEEKSVDGLSEEEVQRRAERLAADMVKQRESKDVEKKFEEDCEALRKQAVKVNKEFDTAVANMAREVAPIPAVMIAMLTDLENDNGGEVLNYFANNHDAYEDIIDLSQARMMQRLIKISDNIEELKKEAKTKTKTRVPEPITPINEGRDSKTANVLPNDPTKNMEDFIRIRNEQDYAKRKARGY